MEAPSALPTKDHLGLVNLALHPARTKAWALADNTRDVRNNPARTADKVVVPSLGQFV